MQSRNRVATELVDEAIDFADELGIEVHYLSNDAVVLDFGVRARGGIEAGLLLTEIATGGLASVTTRVTALADATVPAVELTTDQPALALHACQGARWEFDELASEGEPYGYGPGNLFTDEGRRSTSGGGEDFDFAVLAIAGSDLPDAAVASDVASTAGVPTSGVFLPTASTASLAGFISALAGVAGRVVDRLVALEYEPDGILSATGRAPMVPIAGDEATARANAEAAIGHAGRAYLVVTDDDPVLGRIGHSEMPDDGDPATITVDVVGGPTYRTGSVDEAALLPLFDQ